MGEMTKRIIKELAERIVDNKDKFKHIIRQLEMAGKTVDFCRYDSKGEPMETTYLEMVKLGLTGLSMTDVREVLNA